jgi:hypothetical protein
MRRIVIELKKHSKVSLTPVQGERLDYALRRFANHLRGLEPKQVLLQDYDPRVSSKYRYTPAPQLLKVLRKALSDDLLNGHGVEGEKVNGWKVKGYQPSAVSHRLELKNARRKAVASPAGLAQGVGRAERQKAKDVEVKKPATPRPKKLGAVANNQLFAVQPSRGAKPVPAVKARAAKAVVKTKPAKIAKSAKPAKPAKKAKAPVAIPPGKSAKSAKVVKPVARVRAASLVPTVKPTTASKPKTVTVKVGRGAKPKRTVKARFKQTKQKPVGNPVKRQVAAQASKAKASKGQVVVKAEVQEVSKGRVKGKKLKVGRKQKVRG